MGVLARRGILRVLRVDNLAPIWARLLLQVRQFTTVTTTLRQLPATLDLCLQVSAQAPSLAQRLTHLVSHRPPTPACRSWQSPMHCFLAMPAEKHTIA